MDIIDLLLIFGIIASCWILLIAIYSTLRDIRYILQGIWGEIKGRIQNDTEKNVKKESEEQE